MIDIQTDGTLPRDQVLQTSGVTEGENIFKINLGNVHDRLQQLPQVDEVQVVRRLPAEIDIRLVERKPIAWITSEKDMPDPFSAEKRVSRGRARRFNEREEIAAGTSRIAADLRMQERVSRSGQGCGIGTKRGRLSSFCE